METDTLSDAVGGGGLRLTTRLHLVSRLKMSGDLHPLNACLHGAYRNRFTFNKTVQHDEVISIRLKKRPKTRQNVSPGGTWRNGRCATFSPSGEGERERERERGGGGVLPYRDCLVCASLNYTLSFAQVSFYRM
jgi:hypothetical protein